MPLKLAQLESRPGNLLPSSACTFDQPNQSLTRTPNNRFEFDGNGKLFRQAFSLLLRDLTVPTLKISPFRSRSDVKPGSILTATSAVAVTV